MAVASRPAFTLIAWITICLLAASPAVTFPPGDWYAGLEKPNWTPPDRVFGPVWTVLYVLMGVAAWLAGGRPGLHRAPVALSAFLLQLLLNAAWSVLFFGLRAPGLAFAEILLLLLAVGASTLFFWRRSAPAGALLLPYLAWVSFAALLNYRIWRMNP